MTTADIRPILVSIVIKTLNEERHIGACIASALASNGELAVEVILADSGSTDRTLEIAARYPIRIVQLADVSQRRCGVGPQLGYQFSHGAHVYLLDGDMELTPGFLPVAVSALEADATLAGVAGLVEEESDHNMQFRGRRARNFEGTPGDVRWLDMGGLYRREAIEQVRYLSNQNLYAHEEKELGLRLSAQGWRLTRLPVMSIWHHGHVDPTLPLLKKRWRSGYLFGAGQVLRASFGTPYFFEMLRGNFHLLATLGSILWLVPAVLTMRTMPSLLMAWCTVMALLAAQRIVRHRSWRDGLLCMVVWHVNAVALVRGIFLPQVNPRLPIAAVTLSDNRAVR